MLALKKRKEEEKSRKNSAIKIYTLFIFSICVINKKSQA